VYSSSMTYFCFLRNDYLLNTRTVSKSGFWNMDTLDGLGYLMLTLIRPLEISLAIISNFTEYVPLI
jgi:hypothetical protein